MKLQYVTNTLKDTAVMRIYAPIGWEGVSGQYFADELHYLENQGFKKIQIRINSPGGGVFDGYSIFSAIVNSKMEIDTYIDGMAASMAGVIAMAGKRVYMADYGIFMLHNPAANGPVPQDLLTIVKNGLIKIFVAKTGKDAKELSNLMDVETWLDSSQALEKGFIDEIIKTNKAPVKADTKNAVELFNIYNSLLNGSGEQSTHNRKSKIFKMDRVNALLGLQNEASDEAVINRVSELTKLANETQDALKTLKEENEALKAKLDEFKAKEAEEQKAKAENLVENAIKEGKIKKEAKETWVNLALANFEGVKNSIESFNTKFATKITDSIQVVNDERAGWTLRDWEKKDPKGLTKILRESPEVYNQMFEKQYGTAN